MHAWAGCVRKWWLQAALLEGSWIWIGWPPAPADRRLCLPAPLFCLRTSILKRLVGRGTLARAVWIRCMPSVCVCCCRCACYSQHLSFAYLRAAAPAGFHSTSSWAGAHSGCCYCYCCAPLNRRTHTTALWHAFSFFRSKPAPVLCCSVRGVWPAAEQSFSICTVSRHAPREIHILCRRVSLRWRRRLHWRGCAHASSRALAQLLPVGHCPVP